MHTIMEHVKTPSPNVLMDCALRNWHKIILSGVTIYLGSRMAMGLYRRSIARKKIKRVRARVSAKKSQMRRILAKDDELVTKERLNITQMDIKDLLRKLRSGELKPTLVLEAFQAQALLVDEERNCVCDFIDEALEWACALEAVPEDQRGPLYGLPMSIKECFYVKGYDQTVGLTRFIDQPAPADGDIVNHLKDLGAVPFCLTNLPQTMKSYACSNPIYGITTNPWDNTRSPGGSSGGEGCLIASGGSPLGIGTDVGGSLRIPAHFCGVVGFKPTTGRIYQEGRRGGSAGQMVGVNSNAGFICKTVSGVELGMKLLVEGVEKMVRKDYLVVPVPWQEHLLNPKRKLRVGWYNTSPDLPISPGCKRAVEMAIGFLKEQGHEVVPFQIPKMKELARLYFDHVLADNGDNAIQWLQGEILDNAIRMNAITYAAPHFIRVTLLRWIMALFSPLTSQYSTRGSVKSSQLWLTMEHLGDIIEETLDKMGDKGVDVIIGPGFSFPAPLERFPSKLITAVPVTGIYNILDFPVGSVPITTENQEDQSLLRETYKSRDMSCKLVVKGIQGAIGMPIGVQVIGKPWQEELVLSVMQQLETTRNEKGTFRPVRQN